MTGADFAGVRRLVLEFLVGQEFILIPEQAVFLHVTRVKGDLRLGVLGDDVKSPADFLDQHFPRFVYRVNVGVFTVAVLGDDLEFIVFEITRTETQDGYIDAAFSLFRYEFFQLFVIADADIEVAVGSENDSIIPAFDKVLGRDRVGRLQALGARRCAFGGEILDNIGDHLFLKSLRAVKADGDAARISHDRYRVIVIKRLEEQLKRVLHQWQFIRSRHRPANVKQKDEIVFPRRNYLKRLGLDPDRQ